MIKELTCSRAFFCSRTSDPSPGFFIFLLVCSKIRAEPCKLLHVHWEGADPAPSGVSGHGNTSGCSISHGGGASPPTAMVQEPCTSQPAVKLSKQGLLGLWEACSWLSMWKDCHPSSLTHGVRSTGPREWSECCGSQLQMGLCSLLHGVRSFSLSLCLEREQYSWLFCLVSQPYIHTGFLGWLV